MIWPLLEIRTYSLSQILMQLQGEIDAALPELQEMIITLSYGDPI